MSSSKLKYLPPPESWIRVRVNRSRSVGSTPFFWALLLRIWEASDVHLVAKPGGLKWRIEGNVMWRHLNSCDWMEQFHFFWLYDYIGVLFVYYHPSENIWVKSTSPRVFWQGEDSKRHLQTAGFLRPLEGPMILRATYNWCLLDSPVR